MREYSSEVASEIIDFLNSDDWRYEFDQEEGLIKMSLSTKTKFQSIRIYYTIKKNGFSLLVVFPINATEDVRSQVAEFITRANYGLYFGGFEMDFNDGEVRFRSSLVSMDTLPSREQIRHILYVSLSIAEKYANALASVLFGFADPKDAIELAEKNDN